MCEWLNCLLYQKTPSYLFMPPDASRIHMDRFTTDILSLPHLFQCNWTVIELPIVDTPPLFYYHISAFHLSPQRRLRGSAVVAALSRVSPPSPTDPHANSPHTSGWWMLSGGVPCHKTNLRSFIRLSVNNCLPRRPVVSGWKASNWSGFVYMCHSEGSSRCCLSSLHLSAPNSGHSGQV